MNVVINSECTSVPTDGVLLTSEGQVLLNLLVSLGYDPLNPPLGDLLRKSHKLEGDWVILSPVHWQASHNDALIIAAGADLHITEQESRYWFQLLSDYVHGDGMTLHYHDQYTWLLDVTNKPCLNARSINRVINRSLMPELAQLDTTMFWQKFFTECQMFFASQPNTTSINGVWAWGSGILSDEKAVSICSDEQFISIARICSDDATLYSHSSPLPDSKIILLNTFSEMASEHQQLLRKTPARWYWNNTAYSATCPNWFTRIWRKLTHAH